jgi:hypothetical protein
LNLKNGVLVGKTSKGGINDLGVIFNYNYLQNTFIKTFDFDLINGASPFGGFSMFCKPSRADIHLTVCDSLISASTKYVYKISGVYRDTINTYLGCDSIITYSVKVKKSSFSNIEVKACSTYTSPTNQIIDSSGQYIFLIDNYWGCDSLIRVNLTIQNSNSQINVESCNFYMGPDGKRHDTSGVITAVIPNYQLCDSTIQINLTLIKNNTSVLKNNNILEAEIENANYQWIDCQQGFNWIEGENNKIFTAEANGLYAVIINKNNCTDTSQCYLVDNLSVSKINETYQIKVFPNPNQGIFYIASDETFEYKVIDAVGKTVQSYQSTKEAEVKLNPGLYFIHFKINQKEYTEKIIVW